MMVSSSISNLTIKELIVVGGMITAVIKAIMITILLYVAVVWRYVLS